MRSEGVLEESEAADLGAGEDRGHNSLDGRDGLGGAQHRVAAGDAGVGDRPTLPDGNRAVVEFDDPARECARTRPSAALRGPGSGR